MPGTTPCSAARATTVCGASLRRFGNDTFVGNGGTDAVGAGDPGGAPGDRILVPGTPGNDVINLTLNGAGHLLVTINGVTTTYTNFVGGPIAPSGVDLIAVVGGEGTDSLTVNSATGAIPIAIEFDGGSGSDSLTLTGGVATSDIYSAGPNPGQGTSTIVIGAVTQLVTFQNIEPVIDFVAGPLVVNATPADNAINFAANVITIDNFESIAIGNKTDVTINAGSGSDTININVPAGLSGDVTVNGGNPTASDTLIVNAIAGSLTDNFRILPTAQGAGVVDPDAGTAPSVNYTGIEVIEAVLQYAEDDTFSLDGTAGDDLVQVVSGPVPGSSVITGLMNSAAPFTLPTIRVRNNNPVAGSTGIFNFFGVGGLDDFEVYGTASNDTFDISAATQILHSANGQVLNRYSIAGAAEVTIDGGDGDDTFNVVGIAGGDILHLNGGNPSASDVINYSAAGEVILDLANQTIDDAGLVGSPDVTYTGVEIINLDLNTNDLIIEASGGDDDLTVTVLSATSGKIEQGVAIQRAGETQGNIVPPLVNYSDTAVDADRVVFDMLGGEDTLFVVGNALAQTWLVDVPAGTVSIDDAPLLGNDGFLAWLNNESVQVFGLEGNDAFTVIAGRDSGVRRRRRSDRHHPGRQHHRDRRVRVLPRSRAGRRRLPHRRGRNGQLRPHRIADRAAAGRRALPVPDRRHQRRRRHHGHCPRRVTHAAVPGGRRHPGLHRQRERRAGHPVHRSAGPVHRRPERRRRHRDPRPGPQRCRLGRQRPRGRRSAHHRRRRTKATGWCSKRRASTTSSSHPPVRRPAACWSTKVATVGIFDSTDTLITFGPFMFVCPPIRRIRDSPTSPRPAAWS